MLIIRELSNPQLLRAANALSQCGKLQKSKDHLIYLDISDEYIHQLFPLIKIPTACLPNYFGKDLAGAHISVVYPDEIYAGTTPNLNDIHHFEIKYLAAALIHHKIYYVLIVNAPSLGELRKKLKLSLQPRFKNQLIDFHITIAVELVRTIKC